MGRKRKGARVLGPYYDKSRDRWKITVVTAEGQRAVESCKTKTEAGAIKRVALRLMPVEEKQED